MAFFQISINDKIPLLTTSSLFFLYCISLLGDRYSVQVADIAFPNSRGSSYEGLIFSREPQENESADKRPRQAFRFNMPLRVLDPLIGALTDIRGKEKENENSL
jgi:hypothetical protein